jgi:hypothetical protein
MSIQKIKIKRKRKFAVYRINFMLFKIKYSIPLACRWDICMINNYCTLGWVDIGTNTWVPQECIYFLCKSNENSIKSFLVKWPSEERSFFSGSSTIYMGPKMIFNNVGFMGIIRRRIQRNFLKYKLTFQTKCT